MRASMTRTDVRTDKNFKRWTLHVNGQESFSIEVTDVKPYRPVVIVKGKNGGFKASQSIGPLKNSGRR